MRKTIAGILFSLLLTLPLAALESQDKDAKKLDKELKKISLVAAVNDGRRVVNRVMAEHLGVSRKQLVQERKQTGLTYGDLFGAHEVAKLSGAKFSDVARQIDDGQDVADLAAQRQLKLKTLVDDTRKFTRTLDRELDRVADGDEDEDAQDSVDSYDPGDDSISADTSGLSPSDIQQANNSVHNRGRHWNQGNAARGMSNGNGGFGGPGRGVGPRRGRP